MNDALNRALAVTVCVLLAATLLILAPLNVMADSFEVQEQAYLVVITYNDWDDLQRLASLGLNVLDLQFGAPNLLGEGVLAAIVTSQELTALRSMGVAVRILDSPATLGQYYLVTLPPGRETSFATPGRQVFPYVDRGDAEWLGAGKRCGLHRLCPLRLRLQ